MFRVRAQNVHGWSDWSIPYTEILAASVPAKMPMMTVENGQLSDTAIRVSWSTPNNRGSAISGYEFKIADHDGDLHLVGTELGLAVQVQDTFFELEINLLVNQPFNLV